MKPKIFLSYKNIIIFFTFICILVSGIITNQKAAFMLPIFISLYVMAFQSEANRKAYLLGGINACIYGTVYIFLGLYASAASALLFSFPLQILTFIKWKKKAYGKSTIFKKLSPKARIFVALSVILIFALLYFILTSSWSSDKYINN